jgi:Mn2+/Fe2+ NRAMP family transporter
MTTASIVAILLGVLTICVRGPLIVVPAATLRVYKRLISSATTTRLLGGATLLIALAMVVSGRDQQNSLEGVLFFFGIFMLLIAVPLLLIAPHVHMNIAEGFLPEQPVGLLVGWRLLGLLGATIGFVLIWAGWTVG